MAGGSKQSLFPKGFSDDIRWQKSPNSDLSSKASSTASSANYAIVPVRRESAAREWTWADASLGLEA